MFQLDKIVHLKSTLESEGSHITRNAVPILTSMGKSPKCFKISK